MRTNKIYVYEKCSTCQKTLNLIRQKNLSFEILAIRENPPSFEELSFMLAQLGGKLTKMLNTSSLDYRKKKEVILKMSHDEVLRFLTCNGNLIKRPFVLMDGEGWVGHQEDRFQ